MDTVVLRSVPRMRGDELSIRFEVIGDGDGADDLKEAIRALEHYPSKAERRALLDLMAVIQQENFEVRHAERGEEEGTEAWLFILQR